MNKRIKAGWVAKLRSGQFKQGTDFLRQGKGDEAQYCCLGVLTAMAVKNGVCPANRAWKEDPQEQDLCKEVLFWAKLKSTNPSVFVDYNTTLAELNDRGVSFNKIADIIEKQL